MCDGDVDQHLQVVVVLDVAEDCFACAATQLVVDFGDVVGCADREHRQFKDIEQLRRTVAQQRLRGQGRS